MTDEPMVERLTVALRELFTDGRVSTHYDGCWKYHKGCAALLAAITIDRLTRERDDYRLAWEQRNADARFEQHRRIAAEHTFREQREALERMRAVLTDDESPHLCGRDEDSVDGIYVCKDCALAALAPDTEGEGP